MEETGQAAGGRQETVGQRLEDEEAQRAMRMAYIKSRRACCPTRLEKPVASIAMGGRKSAPYKKLLTPII